MTAAKFVILLIMVSSHGMFTVYQALKYMLFRGAVSFSPHEVGMITIMITQLRN